LNDAAAEVSHWPDEKGSALRENAGANQKIQVGEKDIALSEVAGTNQKILVVEKGCASSENAGTNQKIQVDEKGSSLNENAGANQKMLVVEKGTASSENAGTSQKIQVLIEFCKNRNERVYEKAQSIKQVILSALYIERKSMIFTDFLFGESCRT
jgi:hypothetical protein